MTKTLLASIITLIISCSTYCGFAQDSLFKKEYLPEGYNLTSVANFIKTKDGNFVIGFTSRTRSVTADTWNKPGLLKISPEGKVLWAMRYDNGTGEHTYLNSIAELSTGEIVLVSNHIRSDGSANIHVLKVNNTGNTVWQNIITAPDVIAYTHITIGHNDEIWIGNTIDPTGGKYELLVVKYRPDGSYEWVNKYAANREDILNHIIVNKQGNLVVAVEVATSSDPGRRVELIEIAGNGDMLKRRKFNIENRFMQNIEVVQADDESYYVSYMCRDVNHGGGMVETYAAIFKTDKNFNLLWATLGHKTNTIYNSFRTTELKNGQVLMYGSYGISTGPDNLTSMLVLPINNKTFTTASFIYEPAANMTPSGTGILEGNNGILYHAGVKSKLLPPNAFNYIYFSNFKQDYTFCEAPEQISGVVNIGNVKEEAASPYVGNNIGNVTRGTTSYRANVVVVTLTNKCSVFDFNCASTLNLEDSIVCGADEFTLDASTIGYSYKWSTGDTTASIKVNMSDKYSVMAYAPPIFGCDTLYDSATIILTEPIDAELIGPINAKAYDRVTFSAQGSDAYNYAWDLGDGTKENGQSVQHTYTKTGNYTVLLTVTDTNNCVLTDSLLFNSFGFTYYIPNAFSPNNDGNNDVFAPRGIGIANYKLSIFNRWGELLYQGENEGWTGTYQNTRVMGGEYIYTLTLQSDTYQKVNISGKVFVIY